MMGLYQIILEDYHKCKDLFPKANTCQQFANNQQSEDGIKGICFIVVLWIFFLKTSTSSFGNERKKEKSKRIKEDKFTKGQKREKGKIAEGQKPQNLKCIFI